MSSASCIFASMTTPQNYLILVKLATTLKLSQQIS